MIKLEDIKDFSAIVLLRNYNGNNPYITKFKKKLIKEGTVLLTSNQTKYITDNIDKDPIEINRVVRITPYLGEELERTEGLSFTPQKILIEFILAETDKAYHIYGRLKKNQDVGKLYWLPKTQVLDDPYFEELNVEVDFSKYNDVLGKTGKKLYNHQEIAIKFLLCRKGAILADSMGLGKTVSSIVAALESGANKILVISPSSLKINWEREINMFDQNTAIVDGKNWVSNKFTIINFDILKNFHTLEEGKKSDDIKELNRQIVDGNFDMVIIDEAHFLKNNKSIRTNIMLDICINNNIEWVWLLTGTPIANRPMDYFSLLSMVKSPIAKNWEFFARRYCDAKRFMKTLQNGKRKQIWITDGASNLDELALKTKSLVLRRLKHEVLDMPEKTIIPVYHELTNSGRKEYDNLWDEYLIKRKESGKRTNLDRDLVELILLRKRIALEAIPHTIEIVESAIEQGHKVVIFTNFTDELMELHEKLGKISVIHNGPMKTAEKQRSVDRFQEDDKIRVFIGNIISAGVGITLTAGDIVVFNSYNWVPGSNEQCEDRCYRIGQVNNVTVYYQLFKNSISERIWGVLVSKTDIIEQILNNKEYSDEELMLEMVNYISDHD